MLRCPKAVYPTRVRLTLRFSALFLAAACAETSAPLPPPQELLLVVNTGHATLSLVSLTDGGASLVPLGSEVPAGARVAAGRRYAVVPMGRGDSIAIVELAHRSVERKVAVGSGAGALGVVVVSDSVAYVTLTRLDRILRVNLGTGDTLGIPVGHFPKDIALVRGKLFVVNANLTDCPPPDLLCPAGESWVNVVDPVSNARAGGRDSIPIPGPGNASFVTVAGDGRLYIMSAGVPADPQGRLSIVDPVSRLELGNFGGFGDGPGQIAADRGERIFVSSRTEGLMEFNTRTRTVVRGAGNGIPVQNNAGVAVDSRSQIYAIDAGLCSGFANGRARVFRPDLTEVRTISLGLCSGAAAMALIPAEVTLEAR